MAHAACNQPRASNSVTFECSASRGINAGVILLRPCETTRAHIRCEVTSELHPKHIAGAGPEQEYLSRYFASSPWHAVNVVLWYLD